MTLANFIIAGTEKAGTTSVFSYLARHPEVAASRRKETNFFRSSGTAEQYATHFPDPRGRPVVMEASPAYLGESELVVPRMRALTPDVRLLFILREPVDRFLSSYHFHRTKLNLPDGLTLREYLDACLEFAAADVSERPAVARTAGIDVWFLKVLTFGCYATHLRHYFGAFPRERILVTFYDDLCADPRRFMVTLSGFLGIDQDYWRRAEFKPVNVTFSGRNRALHRLAVRANDALEPWLRPRPKLKAAVVGAYKFMNRAREGYERMPEEERMLLEGFYASHNRELEELLGHSLPVGWLSEDGTDCAHGLQRRGAMTP